MAGGVVLVPASGGDISWRQQLPSRATIYPFSLVTSLFFLWGLAYGLLDALNKHFQNTLGVTKLQSTGLQVAYFGAGYLVFSPVAGEILRRRGYRFTIVMGLTLYSVGAVMFWPCAKFSGEANPTAIFGGFVVCTAVIACGLASLETAANSYIAYLPDAHPSGAAFRLQFSQSFAGVGAFSGPLIASKYFFSGNNGSDLTSVQWVYLAVSLTGVFVAFLFAIYKLPETSEAELEDRAQAAAAASGRGSRTDLPFYKQYRVLFGWLAQFMYIGSQVTMASFFINYGAEAVGWPDAKSSNFLSYSLIIFTAGRFVGVALVMFFPAELLVGIWSLVCVALVACITLLRGTAGIACLVAVLFFEAPIFPCIFVMSTNNMGRHTRRASSLLISAVGGAAVFPPIQGAIADSYSTRISYAINIPTFLYIAAFAFSLWFRHSARFALHEDSAAKADRVPEAAGKTLPELGRTRTNESDAGFEGEKPKDIAQNHHREVARA